MRTPRFPPTRAGPPRRSAGSAGAGNNVTVCALVQILDELDRRDLHGQEAHGARVYHLGLSDHLVSDTLAAVATRPRPAIRSGHLGNWEEIRRGRVGLVDYNRYICRDYGLGIPVVHTHTFTENADLTDGDTIYLPAGRIERSSYERLPILVKRGEMLQPLDPNDSICCAFAYLYTDSGPLPMVAARAAELSGFPGATTIPTMLCRDEQLLRRALTALIAQALDAPGGLTLDQVFGSSVNRQGRRGEAPIAVKGGFVASGTRYSSRESLVDAALEGLRFGSLEPGDVHAADAPENDYLPLLGATTVLALVAYLDCRVGGGDPVHAHWGAISMAGYPPLSGGYFGRRSARRALRQLGEGLAELPDFAFDRRFALLPAPILSLLPPAEFGADCERVDDLITTIVKTTEPPGADPRRAVTEITGVVRTWLAEHGPSLTPYYRNRFGLSRSVFNGTADVPTDGAPHDASLLGTLTMRQGSILLGALIEDAKQLTARDS